MTKAVLLMTLILCSFATLAQRKKDPVKVYADSMARAVVADNEGTLIANFAPIVLGAYTKGQLLKPLASIRNQFGTISQYEYRRTTVGGRLVGHRKIRTATYWYAATTSKFPTRAFLKVAITYDQGRFYLANYSVVRFVGNHIPPGLRSANAKQ